MAFTKITNAGFGLTTGTLVGVAASFSSTVSVGGTLTYEDVTNVDSVGLITARNGIEVTDKGVQVGTGATVDSAGDNILTFLTNGSERLRITGDGPHLLLGGTADVNEITESSSNAGMVIGGTSVGNGGLAIINSTSGTGRIYFGDATGSDAARNRGQISYYHNGDYMMFATAGSERLRITGIGSVGVGINAPTAQFQVNSTKNAETDRHDATNYHLALRNPADDNGEAIGLSFGITSNATKVGAAILHERDGGGSQGSLQFYTSSDGNSVTERVRIDSSGRMGIATTPEAWSGFDALEVNEASIVSSGSGDAFFTANAYYDGAWKYKDTGVARNIYMNSDGIVFRQAASGSADAAVTWSESMRLDSSGRLLVGASSARGNFFNSSSNYPQFQIEGTDSQNSALSLTRNVNSTGYAPLHFAKSRGTSVGSNTIVQSGDYLGGVIFSGSDGSEFVSAAAIHSEVDGTPGANDMPGRLTFHTTADGASSPTERMRIDKDGDVMIGTTSNAAHANSDNLIIGSTSESYQGLTINASTGSQIRFADAANNSIGYVIYNHGSNKLEFGCNGAEGFIVTQNRFIQTGGYTNNSAQYHRVNGRDQTQGTVFAVFSGYQTSNGSSGDTAYFYSCNTGVGPNSANTAMSVFRNALTSRSINASGTINASGNDYAEYMTKAGNFTLAKGDICGVNSEGKLTNVFADAISFVVKSTDPSYVGGDTWHTTAGEKPGGYDDDRTEEEIAAATVVYEEALETARQLVDRIAFSGQVPVNVTGATPGQHIIPTAAADGSIEGTAKAEADLTMAEYMSSVGKVIAIGDDGRAKIIVKVA